VFCELDSNGNLTVKVVNLHGEQVFQLTDIRSIRSGSQIDFDHLDTQNEKKLSHLARDNGKLLECTPARTAMCGMEPKRLKNKATKKQKLKKADTVAAEALERPRKRRKTDKEHEYQEIADQENIVQVHQRNSNNQRKFREYIFKRLGEKCVITNDTIEVEAAHVESYFVKREYPKGGGLPLSQSCHNFFDKYYFTICRDEKHKQLRIYATDELRESSFGENRGEPIHGRILGGDDRKRAELIFNFIKKELILSHNRVFVEKHFAEENVEDKMKELLDELEVQDFVESEDESQVVQERPIWCGQIMNPSFNSQEFNYEVELGTPLPDDWRQKYFD
jgi:hypothetical protein